MASSRSTRPPAKRGGPLRGRHPLAERAIRSAACRGATLVLSCETLADAERARDAAAVVRHSRARRRRAVGTMPMRPCVSGGLRGHGVVVPPPPPPPPRAKLAEPFQLKFAISARPTSVTRLRRRLETLTAVVAAAAAAGCCCALTRTEPGRNRAHRTHEAPAACVECVACERARWRGVARRAAAAAAAVRLARLI
jgi:hypothetical protein